MKKRKIIKIDEKKCNGCSACIPNCPEGAIQIIDKKARLMSDLFCDGLGACLGHCPQGAIIIEERAATAYNERKVMANVVKQGGNVIKAHLRHLLDHNQKEYYKQACDFLKEKKIKVSLEESPKPSLHQGCPGMKLMDFREELQEKSSGKIVTSQSQLRQWPVQLMLVPPQAPYLNNTDLLIAADCVPFAYANFHEDLLKGKMLLVGCPKLDDLSHYNEKITAIVSQNNITSISYAHMEVPCCFGLIPVIKEAIAKSGKKIPFSEVTITIKGERK